jgi:hypothetical protein
MLVVFAAEKECISSFEGFSKKQIVWSNALKCHYHIALFSNFRLRREFICLCMVLPKHES